MGWIALVTGVISISGMLYAAPDWWMALVVAVIFVWPALYALGCMVCGKMDEYMSGDWHGGPGA